MVAYLIVDTKISDADAYEIYKAQAKPLVEKHGGIYRVRGGDMEVLESDIWEPTRMVVIEFPDMAAARTFIDSEAYGPVRTIRRDNAQCTVVLVDGV